MKTSPIAHWRIAAALLALGVPLGLNCAYADEPAAPAAQQGVEILTRGPVHEAFAETVTFDPQPGIKVAKAPPAAIEELPPEQRLAGANVAWVPGYWAWDDERSNFLWVSGIWRDLPPGRQWVPGYWGQSGSAYQWTSGYWANGQAANVEYLPEPPATAENGPNIAAPSPDNIWLPGSWMWNQDRYAWRPGFWAGAQPNWDWVPSHYIWAPRGYVYVDGYWDYSIGRRGVLFAPVFFNGGMYTQPGFSYSPSTVINPAVFADNLFLRPQYQHYYFGDYYAANYQTEGFYPSYSYNSGRQGYDPIFAHERWQHRQDAQWEHRVVADFQNRRAHVDARPARTWTAQNALGVGAAQPGEHGIVMAAPLSTLLKTRESPLRFEPVDRLERQKLVQHGQDVQRFREERQKLEARAATQSAGQAANRFAPSSAKLPMSPIAARPNAELGKDHIPPQLHVAPKPDLTVEAKPRPNRVPEQPQQRTVNKIPLDTKPAPANVPAKPARVDRPAPQPQPQPQPKAERPAAPVHVDRPAPQPQPKVDRPAPQPQPHPVPAGPSHDNPKEKGKDK